MELQMSTIKNVPDDRTCFLLIFEIFEKAFGYSNTLQGGPDGHEVAVAVYAEISLLDARVVYCYIKIHIFITLLGAGANKTVCLSK
jgi:hypothetical protein